MSLNYSSGKPICQIGKKTIFVSDDKGGEQTIKLEKKDEIFLPAIDKDTEREIVYISGASGSGKSYVCKRYIEQYHKAYPKRNVYMFSSLSDDPTLDKLKYLKRIKIKEEKFLSLDLTAEDFRDSLVIYDDTDTITHKKIALKLLNLLSDILNCGRHNNVSLLYTSHILCDGHKTKHILSEAHMIVLYPLTASKKHLTYLLQTYFGFDKEDIQRLIELDGRPKFIKKTYPFTCYGEREVYIK